MKVLGVDVQPAEVESERVLDVPTIDMTDRANARKAAATPPASAAKPPRRKPSSKTLKPRSKGKKAVRARAAKAAETPASRRRDGSVGRETFQAVEDLVSTGMKKAEAFKQVARKTNRSAGTVATTYYRLAGQRATPAPKPAKRMAAAGHQGTRQSQRRARNGRAVSGGPAGIEGLAGELVSTLTQLSEAVSQQSRELAELRSRVDGMRKVIS